MAGDLVEALAVGVFGDARGEVAGDLQVERAAIVTEGAQDLAVQPIMGEAVDVGAAVGRVEGDLELKIELEDGVEGTRWRRS